LIHGWSESDASLAATPETWWHRISPTAHSHRGGLIDIARVWDNPELVKKWRLRAGMLTEATIKSIERNVKRDMTPPYIGPCPARKLTFRESMATERPSPQQWPHRP